MNDRLRPTTLQLLASDTASQDLADRHASGSSAGDDRAAPTPSQPTQPPYYAVIFTSLRNGRDRAGYALMAEHMVRLAAQQPGFLGMHTARGVDGLGITVSYWRSQDDILAWRQVSEHRVAQQAGQDYWYAGYELQIARVERAYAHGAGLLGSPMAHAAQADIPLELPSHQPPG